MCFVKVLRIRGDRFIFMESADNMQQKAVISGEVQYWVEGVSRFGFDGARTETAVSEWALMEQERGNSEFLF